MLLYLLLLYFVISLTTVVRYFQTLKKNKLFKSDRLHDIFVTAIYGWLITFFYVLEKFKIRNVLQMERVIVKDQVVKHVYRILLNKRILDEKTLSSLALTKDHLITSSDISSVDDMIFCSIAARHSVRRNTIDNDKLIEFNKALETKIKEIKKVIHLNNCELRLNQEIDENKYSMWNVKESYNVSDEITEFVKNKIEKFVPTDSHIILLCSGGKDSMTLAHVLKKLYNERREYTIIHFNWRKRNEADYEASLLKKYFGDNIHIHYANIDKHDENWDYKATEFKKRILENYSASKKSYVITGHVITDIVENIMCNVFSSTSKMNQRSILDIFGMEELTDMGKYYMFRPLLLHDKPVNENVPYFPDNAENLDVQRRVFRRMNIPYDVQRLTILYEDNQALKRYLSKTNSKQLSGREFCELPTFILKKYYTPNMSVKSIEAVKNQLRRLSRNISVVINNCLVNVNSIDDIVL